MKVYKIELMIVDFDDVGPEEIKHILETTRYPNRCINPTVMHIYGRELGTWSDDNPLNNRDTAAEEYRRLFSKFPLLDLWRKE